MLLLLIEIRIFFSLFLCKCILRYYSHAHAPTKLLQSCPTLCDSMDCNPPGFSIHGILQARMLRWAAMLSSRESSRSKDQTFVSGLLHWQVDSLLLAPSGKPHTNFCCLRECSVISIWLEDKVHIIVTIRFSIKKIQIWKI